MPSSPITADDRHQTLLAALSLVPDPRGRRGRRYRLPGLLALAVTAVLAGARSFTAIGQWASECTPEQLAEFDLGAGRAPDESTLRYLFARLDATALDAAISVWMTTGTLTDPAGRQVIAVDGKTIRGARTDDRPAPHLVAAFDTTAGAVLGQLCVEAKTNEIPTARALLSVLPIKGAVITMDAMHTQTDTATLITDRGADYVLTVKANMPTLHHDLKDLPWNHVGSSTSTVRHRGKTVTRTIKVVDAPTWITVPGAQQVAQLRRTVTQRRKRPKKTVEIVYLITSAAFTECPPTTLAAWTRQHWGIENRLHWVRDVVFGEDSSRVRTGHAPRVMASLRNIALNILRLRGVPNIGAELRTRQRFPDQTIKIVLTS